MENLYPRVQENIKSFTDEQLQEEMVLAKWYTTTLDDLKQSVLLDIELLETEIKERLNK